jgi:predicted lipoprotein with Yx(FWY)xxD motif
MQQFSTRVRQKWSRSATNRGVDLRWGVLALVVAVAVVATLFAGGSTPPHRNVVLLSEHVVGLGTVLAGPNGRTLYIYGPDRPNDSTCTGGCLGGWPPLTVPDGDTLSLPASWHGTLTTFIRAGGTRQVALNGHPLYYFSYDSSPGAAEGQCSGYEWLVVAERGSSALWSHPESVTVAEACHDLSTSTSS